MFRRLRLPRRPSAPSPASPALSASPLHHARCKHDMPRLRYNFDKGVPNFLSPMGFQIAYTSHMELMTEKLTAMTVGTELEGKNPHTILLLTARDPKDAPLFNYASMAHNSHFFINGISPAGTPMPENMQKELEASFSSLTTLKEEFVHTAQAMFGPGFVWLVKAGHGDYRVLATYLAGSPYAGAHWRSQKTDMNTVGNQGSARSWYQNQASASKKRGLDLPPGGIEVEPLLCLSTWEHSWLYDYGFGVGGMGGKMAYAEAWWDRIDWEEAARLANIVRPGFKEAGQAAAAR